MQSWSWSRTWPAVLWVVPLWLIVLLVAWASRRSQGRIAGMANWSRSKAKVHVAERPKTTFDGVAGHTSVKGELREVVEVLKDAERVAGIGARTPRGELPVGPPGRGKTLVTRAIAGEAGLGGGHHEREQTRNQLVSEMDGFEADEGIIVLAATNRPDILDPALPRAGRVDRQVVFRLPPLEGRRAILDVYARGKRVDPDADLDTLARGTLSTTSRCSRP